MNQTLLRELGCAHRTFRTVRGALVWFARYQEGDDSNLGDVRVSASREAQERARNTFSMLLLALRPTAPGVDNFNLQHIGKLIDWHCAWDPQQEMAKDWGFPSMHATRQVMHFTESVLWERLKLRGLVTGEQRQYRRRAA